MSNQIVTASEMRQLDKLTIEQQNMTSFTLMKRVAKHLYEYIRKHNIIDPSEKVLVVAGTGNNGGDAILVGHHLMQHGTSVKVLMIGSEQNQSEESILATKELRLRVKHIDSAEDKSYQELIDDATVIIDGVFGIGLTREVLSPYDQVIEAINHSYAKVVSIDIPSGIHADNGLIMNTAVIADETLVIQNLKQGNLLNDANDYCGTRHVVDCGILQSEDFPLQDELNMNYLQGKIPIRKHNSYKYHYGNVLTIGGSKGMMGAPILSALAALRMGSGLSQVYYNNQYLPHIPNVYPDLMIDTFSGIEDIPTKTQKTTAVIYGPGLGKKDPINLDILSYILSTSIPLVVDADGLYYLKQLLKEYNHREQLVITPHYKEMADFLGVSITDIEKEPILYAKNIAHTFNVTVVLKGTCTIITNDEETYFSSNGTPGLAKAGTGDVLSGIIGSLLGKGYTALEACKLGVLIHSQAGQYASTIYGEASMLASDVITMIAKVIEDATA